MSANTKIEWSDATWNPVLGCDKISPGCKNCYAIRTAWRLQHNPNPKVAKAFEGLTVLQGGQPNWTGRINFMEERLLEPIRWREPRRIFVNSQSDLFHDGVSFEQIQKIWDVMAACIEHGHTFQVLTKRPERMLEFTRWMAGQDHVSIAEWPRNVWLGVSCENQQTADERIPLLLQTPAAVRWVSAEPLLGPLDLRLGDKGCNHPHLDGIDTRNDPGKVWRCQMCKGAYVFRQTSPNTHDDFPALNWVVAGGESGPSARLMHPDWARSLRDQCHAAGVPFFFKQWGEWIGAGQEVERTVPDREYHRWPNGTISSRIGKKAAGRLLDGKEWNQYPAERG